MNDVPARQSQAPQRNYVERDQEREAVPDGRFTPLQGQYLAFIRAYTLIHGVAPSEADMQRFFRVTPPSVHRMVLLLEKRGWVQRVPGKARSLRILVPPEVLPMLEDPRLSESP